MPERIAIVVPRCAPAAYGGAETFALRLAAELRERFDVTILTTRAIDYWSWENALPGGLDEIEGVPVERFTIDAVRNLREFDRLSRSFRFRIASLSTAEQEAWIKAQGPYSTPLLQYLFEHRTAYDAFVFLPYLYATTYFGLPIVRERSVLLPLAHDEWPLYLPSWERVFGYARSFAFVTPEERALVWRRFPHHVISGEILYPRLVDEEPFVPRPSTTALRAFAQDREGTSTTMLYLGRMDESKGVPELIGLYLAHLERRPNSPWRLVLAGPPDAHRPLPEHEPITYLGEICAPEKLDVLRRCDLVAVPSTNESLSLALLEGWAHGKPGLVNGRSPVLVGQARRANGALWYEDTASFDAALQTLDEPTRAALGAQGRAFIEQTYRPGNAVEVFERITAALRSAA